MVVCGKCKYTNTMGHVFCTQCGAKLDLEAAGKQERVEARTSAFKARAIRFLILDLVVLILVVTALIFWPADPDAARGEDKHFQSARATIVALEKGGLAKGAFSEAEINAALAMLLKKRLDDEGKTLVVRLRTDGMRVTVLSSLGPLDLGAFSLGPFPFTYSVTGRPRHGDDRMVFDGTAAAVGHLPLVGPLRKLAFGPVARLFEGQEKMRALADRISRFELTDGSLAVAMDAKAP